MWLYLRERYLSHRLLADYDAVVEACCTAWNALTAETGRIRSLTAYPYLEQVWAVIASLIETCKLIGVEPRAYLADVISRIVNGHPQSRLDELLPWAYPTTPALKAAA